MTLIFGVQVIYFKGGQRQTRGAQKNHTFGIEDGATLTEFKQVIQTATAAARAPPI
jgi:hypothetical protein